MLVEEGLEMAEALLQISEKYVDDERSERKKQQEKSYTEQVDSWC